MDWDEPQQQRKREIVIGEDLSTLSVDELNQRIEALKAEIERLKAERTKKEAHEAAANAVFKS